MPRAVPAGLGGRRVRFDCEDKAGPDRQRWSLIFRFHNLIFDLCRNRGWLPSWPNLRPDWPLQSGRVPQDARHRGARSSPRGQPPGRVGYRELKLPYLPVFNSTISIFENNISCAPLPAVYRVQRSRQFARLWIKSQIMFVLLLLTLQLFATGTADDTPKLVSMRFAIPFLLYTQLDSSLRA